MAFSPMIGHSLLWRSRFTTQGCCFKHVKGLEVNESPPIEFSARTPWCRGRIRQCRARDRRRNRNPARNFARCISPQTAPLPNAHAEPRIPSVPSSPCSDRSVAIAGHPRRRTDAPALQWLPLLHHSGALAPRVAPLDHSSLIEGLIRQRTLSVRGRRLSTVAPSIRIIEATGGSRIPCPGHPVLGRETRTGHPTNAAGRAPPALRVTDHGTSTDHRTADIDRQTQQQTFIERNPTTKRTTISLWA